MAERLPDRRHRETHEGGPRGSERPAEPKNPPGASALGLMPCAKPGAASGGMVAPRYRRSSHGEASEPARHHEGGDDRGRSRSRHRAHRRRRDKALPAEDRREETPPKKKAKRSSAASAPAAPPPAKSSSSSSSSEEEIKEEPAPKSSSMALATAPTAAVPAWLQSRVDGVTRKAAVFSRALTRAQQALRTAARIAREAAQSFECELEHFQLAQREVEKEFGLHSDP